MAQRAARRAGAKWVEEIGQCFYGVHQRLAWGRMSFGCPRTGRWGRPHAAVGQQRLKLMGAQRMGGGAVLLSAAREQAS